MITSDYVTGRLCWNTAAVAPGVIREAKGKGPKKVKRPSVDTSGLTRGGAVGKTSVSDLDTLVGSMAAHETLPTGAGEGKHKVSKEDTGAMDEYKSRTHHAYGKGPTPRYDSVAAELDRIAAKYGALPASASTKRRTTKR